MQSYNPINSPALANMASVKPLYLLILLLTCSQKAQVIALPIGNATRLFPTSIPSNTLIQSTWKNTTSTQYPPTTTVHNTIPGTKGVSGFSFHGLEKWF